MSESGALPIPEIPAQFIMRLKNAPGKDFIKKEGLIYLGHLQGLKRIDIQVIVFPTTENPIFCIARAEVETRNGIFSDYGTVSPTNKGAVGGSYPVEMACTRASNRALRQATNCPLTSYEEMGMETIEGETVPDAPDQPKPARQRLQESAPVHPAASPAQPPSDPVSLGDGEPASQQQIDRLHKLQAALGQPGMVPSNLTSDAAAAKIADLVRRFNAQSRDAQRSGGK